MNGPRPAGDRPRGGGLPPRYYGFAHLCLLLAFGALAAAPRSIAGFHYHPRMVAVVHLVTLGWISASILGTLYLLAPLTFGARIGRRRGDGWALGLLMVGALGMATHFWIDEPVGMLWSAALVIAAFDLVAGRIVPVLRAATAPAEIKVYFYLAFANLALAVSLGFLVGLDKVVDVLPGRALANVYAHAHLAALGWVLMTVMGAGYRLLPMLLPAAPPRGGLLWTGAIALEIGTLGLAASLAARPALARWFLLPVLAALAIFFSRVVWMLRHRRPPGPGTPRPDHGIRLVFGALALLLAATILGAAILLAPDGAWKLSAILAYGACGLLGFTQLVVGVATRLLPLYAYLAAPPDDETCSRPAPPPNALVSRPLQALVTWLWLAGAPLLVLALTFDRIPWIRTGALLLLAAVIAGYLSQRTVLARAGTRRAAAGPPPEAAKKRGADDPDPTGPRSDPQQARDERAP